ncbi:hypothetical protein L228DRAFT_245469 [Xylona heveae TC161]|uniref:F-box domain-containing protein n=1 Tax=Xylona heveae (strain CBS 132557 / TC161) TaxID=1328760 RepID=A0A165I7W5_XYLHT|nr:hypothetical protein L228DRAFT_245469 [Xylona heveae TC161]KZF24513.1 hypothetical protein L228DRAFT_245469 [Xylona heveae TC161]
MNPGQANRSSDASAKGVAQGNATAGLGRGSDVEGASLSRATGFTGSVEAAYSAAAAAPKTRYKTPLAFSRLPDSVIEHILILADPNTFSSLVYLNKHWYRISQQARLYAHQLSRCADTATYSSEVVGTYAAHSGTAVVAEHDLPSLRQKFAIEAKRSLFAAYGVTRKTIVNLIPPTASSSVATPVGETLRFSITHNGHRVLAWSSSRIFVISTAINIPRVERQFKVQRRPVTAELDDSGTTLAVLLVDHRINVYDIKSPKAARVCSVLPDNTPRAIALSPDSSVLAVAFDGGVEIHSLIPGSLPSSRTVKCDQIDDLSFSRDGSVLLGTTLQSSSTGTVILSAPPFAPEGSDDSSSHGINQTWTTQIIFPQSSRHLSHAVILPHVIDGETGWVFAFDEIQRAFRAVRIEDPNTGYDLFTLSSSGSQTTVTLPKVNPSASNGGGLVVAAGPGNQVYFYKVPEILDEAFPKAKTFTGRRIPVIEDLSAIQWVSLQEGQHSDVSDHCRLLATAQGSHSSPDDYDIDGSDSAEGGRLLLFDFGHLIGDEVSISMCLNLGEGEPELLEEEKLHHEVEVAIARRRTIAQGRSVASRSTESNRGNPEIDAEPTTQTNSRGRIHSERRRQQSDTPLAASLTEPFQPNHPTTASPASEEIPVNETQDMFDTPYSHNQPRSPSTLQRAATAAAASRSRSEREPEPVVAQPQIQPADDADGWVAPPPPYKPDPDEPLPEHLRLTLLPRSTEPVRRVTSLPDQPPRAATDLQQHLLSAGTIGRSRSRIGRASASLSAGLFPGRSPSSERRRSRSKSPSPQPEDSVTTSRRSSDLELSANISPVSGLSLPSAEQLASLQNRVSRPPMPEHSQSDMSNTRSQRLSPSNVRPSLWSVDSMADTQQSSPPEAGTRASRSGRRGSAYSSYSSAPDLQRPNLTRLETIHSVSSLISHLSRPQSRPRSRETRFEAFPSRSRSQTARRALRRPPPQRTASASGSRFQEVGLGPVTNGKATKAEKKAAKKMKRKDRVGVNDEGERRADATAAGDTTAEGGKKAAKCMVM